MFCSKCGKEIFDEAVICPYCGCATNNENILNAETEKLQNNDKSKKLGVAFIISGAINTVISFAFACLPNVMYRGYDYNYVNDDAFEYWNYYASYRNNAKADLLELVDGCGYVHTGMVVICIILLILGIVFTAKKKPLVSKKAQTVTTILMTVGIAVVNILLLIPYIIFQFEY